MRGGGTTLVAAGDNHCSRREQSLNCPGSGGTLVAAGEESVDPERLVEAEVPAPLPKADQLTAKDGVGGGDARLQLPQHAQLIQAGLHRLHVTGGPCTRNTLS